MKCKKCGCELNENDVFCAECGTKVEQTVEPSFTTEAKEPTKKKPMKLILIGVVAVVCVIAGILFLGDKPEDINMEAKELGAIIYTEEIEEYYQDNLHVHGLLMNDPTQQDRYSLYSDDPEDAENGFVFVFAEGVENTIGDSLGNGSELTVTGTLGHYTDSPSAAMLLVESVEIINKVEPVYNVGSVDELLANRQEYKGKRVCVVGQIDGVATSAWIWNSDQTIPVKLNGMSGSIAYEDVADWTAAIVTGLFTVNEYGEDVINVESVE